MRFTFDEQKSKTGLWDWTAGEVETQFSRLLKASGGFQKLLFFIRMYISRKFLLDALGGFCRNGNRLSLSHSNHLILKVISSCKFTRQCFRATCSLHPRVHWSVFQQPVYQVNSHSGRLIVCVRVLGLKFVHALMCIFSDLNKHWDLFVSNSECLVYKLLGAARRWDGLVMFKSRSGKTYTVCLTHT